MIPRRSLEVVLSSLISQLSLLIVLLHPSSTPTVHPLLSLPSTPPNPHQSQSRTLFSLLLNHFILSTSSTLFLLSPPSRKRKRTTSPPPTLLENPVDLLLRGTPDPFQLYFHMSPSTFDWLFDLLEPLLDDDCRHPVRSFSSPLTLPPRLRLGIGFYRLSTGSEYPEIARIFRVSEGAARFCSKQLCRVLCNDFRFWVGFPDQNELKSVVSKRFEDLTGLPNCCGVIGCVRFAIKTPANGGGGRGGQEEERREEEEVVAAQIVVDSNSRILSIAAGFRGERSDSEVLKSSSLYEDVSGGVLLNSPPDVTLNGTSVPQYFVGIGCDYPLLPWLMVPFVDPPPGSGEEGFNSALQSSALRVPLQKTVASLKNWGVLSRPIAVGEMRNGVAYIGACAILHNALLMREDLTALCEGDVEGFGVACRRCNGNLEGGFVDGKALAIRRTLVDVIKSRSRIG